MKLSQPFVRLPLQFDAARLAAEVAALPAQAWVRHPTGFEGNSAARLITVNGGENDDVSGVMQATPHLLQSPYIQQVLASFGTVWSRSRLMKLAPGAQVPEHSDVNYHWFQRVRVHIPIVTRPGVQFYCDDQVVHMPAGEAWIFDNWRHHRVDNATPHERIHLVADTSGSAMFWQLVARGIRGEPSQMLPYQPNVAANLLLERYNRFRVMSPPELDFLLRDLVEDTQAESDVVAGAAAVSRFASLVDSFRADWRQVWSLHGDSDGGIEHFRRLLNMLGDRAKLIGAGLQMRSNQLPAMTVLDARVLQHALNDQKPESGTARATGEPVRAAPAPPRSLNRPRPAIFEQPIFIVAAPRSGSTLLFETLACTPQLATVGGEAHWLVEGFDHLKPGAPGIDSNRIGADQATAAAIGEMQQALTQQLRDSQGRPLNAGGRVVRLLEKTPKNSLRIPFFDRAFPNAKFIFLWRDPRENISSIIDAWRAGGWVTYPRLPGWDGSWSLLLPPGWRELRGRPLEEVAAFQWQATNTIAMDDLSRIDPQRRMVLSYQDFLRDPAAEVSRIAAFAGIQLDSALRQRVARALPTSAHTLTAPTPDKWRKNEALIERVIDGAMPVAERLLRYI